jgi:hypothetical protein
MSSSEITSTEDAIEQIDNLYNTYEKNWYDLEKIIESMPYGKDLVKKLDVNIPESPDSESNFYLMPTYKINYNGTILQDTLDELMYKITKWKQKINYLKKFIIRIKEKRIIIGEGA